jgi:hypothetical protein
MTSCGFASVSAIWSARLLLDFIEAFFGQELTQFEQNRRVTPAVLMTLEQINAWTYDDHGEPVRLAEPE